MKLSRTLLALLVLPAPCFAGNVRITAQGTVTQDSYNSGPFASLTVGSPVTVEFEVTAPGVVALPFAQTDYRIDQSTFQISSGGAALAGQPAVGAFLEIKNELLSADGATHSGPLSNGDFFALEFTAPTSFWGTTRINNLSGTYPIASTATSFSMRFSGAGGFLGLSYDSLTIESLTVGTHFCFPNDNSTGQPTGLAATNSLAAGSGIHLGAYNGPPNEFGYFMAGTSLEQTGVVISAGILCLDLNAPNRIGRYNLIGTTRNSLGQFDVFGTLQNIAGTSSIGEGFDVPVELPLPGTQVLAAGQTWYFQLWHRDGANSNFSDVVRILY